MSQRIRVVFPSARRASNKAHRGVTSVIGTLAPDLGPGLVRYTMPPETKVYVTSLHQAGTFGEMLDEAPKAAPKAPGLGTAMVEGLAAAAETLAKPQGLASGTAKKLPPGRQPRKPMGQV